MTAENGHWQEDLGPLSDREMELLRLLATGATNREIARDLVISVNTVKVHLRNIYTKLNVASRTEATMVAVREGWIAVARPEEETQLAEELPAAPSPVVLPPRERWPRISLARRVGLAFALLLAVTTLFLPQVLQGGTNGEQRDPLGAVFPSGASGSPANRWSTRAQMPTPRTGLAVVAQGERIWAIGGVGSGGPTSRVEVYDPRADTWTVAQAKPTATGFVRAAVLDNKIYVPGGFDAGQQPRDLLEVYDLEADRWETGASLPEPLGAYGLAALGGRLYLFGGRSEEGYVDSAYSYDPATDRWQAIRRLSGPRGFLDAAALGERIYVVGGYDGTAELKTCEVYDPATDAWTSCAPMDMARGGLALVAVREHLFAIGGGMEGYLAYNERYDPQLDAWLPVETPVLEQWWTPGASLVATRVYAIGGWKGAYLSANEAYQALYQFVLTP